MAQRLGARDGATERAPEADGPERPARHVRRRRGLPGGRAVVGGLLVAVAGVGMFAASSRTGGGARRAWVVAARPLDVGTRIQAADLTTASMDLGPALGQRAFDDRDVLVGATLIAPLGQGELVQASAVVVRRGEAASRELSFVLDRGALSPGIKEGERADLLATYGTGADAFTTVVVRQALIVAVERARTTTGDGPSTVTVSIDEPADALALAHATQQGKLTLVRATGAPVLPPVPGTYRVGRA